MATEAFSEARRSGKASSGSIMPWVMRMRWNDLCFLHWVVRYQDLRPMIPDGLELDTYAGDAWLGITPFWMSNVRPRMMPAVPGFSTFPELNVRTYVTHKGKPGIWFLSLDADSICAVEAARFTYFLPYYPAKMGVRLEGGTIRYVSERRGATGIQAVFRARYRPTGSLYAAEPGTLDYFLTERYCLYSVDRMGQLFRGDIAHPSWPLQTGVAEIEVNTMAAVNGIQLPNVPPLVHYSAGVDVRAWYLTRV